MVKVNREALAKYLIETAQERFEWGVCDCVTFAVTGAEFAWDVDLLSHLPSWDNKEEALLKIKEYGNDLREAANKGLPSAGCSIVKDPQPGDIVVADTPGGITFCLCIDTTLMAAMSKNGILFFPIKGDIWRYTGWEIPYQQL